MNSFPNIGVNEEAEEDEDQEMQAALKDSEKTAKAERRKIRDNERSAFADEISPEASSLSS